MSDQQLDNIVEIAGGIALCETKQETMEVLNSILEEIKAVKPVLSLEIQLELMTAQNEELKARIAELEEVGNATPVVEQA